MKLYRTKLGCILEHQDQWYSAADFSWDDLVARNHLEENLRASIPSLSRLNPESLNLQECVLAPIGQQEVWAAGVTYHRSRDARLEESESAGGGNFYDRVYNAERPELFFKATPHRVVGHKGKVAIRQDANWSVPEPELALLVSPSGKILGYTIGNDMSSRDIEGEMRTRPGNSGFVGTVAPLYRDPNGHLARWQIGLLRLNDAEGTKTRAGYFSSLSLLRQFIPERVLSVDRNRHCASGFVYAASWRRNPNCHRWHWELNQFRRLILDWKANRAPQRLASL